MHELSLAKRLVKLAVEKAGESGASHIEAVHVRLGALPGVAEDALRFSFDVASRGTLLHGARLVIDKVPIAVMCPQCRLERILPDILPLRCPVCGTHTADVIQGRELELSALEVGGDPRGPTLAPPRQ